MSNRRQEGIAMSLRGERRVLTVLLVALLLFLGVSSVAGAPNAPGQDAAVTALVSATPGGPAGEGFSDYPSASADGRIIAFLSYSSDLVEGDTNEQPDVFVRDVELGTMVRASVASDGTESNGGVGPPAISADGRYVVFPSEATNLVHGDVNTCPFFPMPGTCPDVFVHDLVTGETRLVSVRRAGDQADGESLYVSISGDGRFVAFASLATNLTARDRNGRMDVFVKDMETGTVRRVSDAPGTKGANEFSFAPSISADGSAVAFTSAASNLVRRDRNGVDDVVVRDLETWELRRVSVRADGSESPGPSFGASISATGRFVAFGSTGDLKDRNGVNDGYVYDLRSGRLRRFTIGLGGAEPNAGLETPPSISADGQLVAFASPASNLIPRDRNGAPDVFVRDLPARETQLISAATTGGPADGTSEFPWISGDGCWVAFGSYAPDLADLGGGGGEESAQVFARGAPCATREGPSDCDARAG